MKKIVVFVLITMILLTTTTSFAGTYSTNPNEIKYEDYALKLKEIGVFKGTSSGFELDREPTRVEVAVMFVRLLGAEKEALEKKYKHPFTDVPKWASDYVGYLYHEKLTNGTSETTFGSVNNIQAKSYITFILRALGYNDLEGDFSWSESLEFAKNKGIINEEDFNELNTKTFLRDHVAKVSYKALKASIKDEEKTLIEKLVDENLIDKGKAEDIGLMVKVCGEEKVKDAAEEEYIEKEEETKELTPELIKKLQSYPYYIKEPSLTFEDISSDLNTAKKILEDFWSIRDQIFEVNEEFLTNNKLLYRTWNNDYAVRGVLKTKLDNGYIVEQYVDLFYCYKCSGDVLYINSQGDLYCPDEETEIKFTGYNFLDERILIKVK